MLFKMFSSLFSTPGCFPGCFQDLFTSERYRIIIDGIIEAWALIRVGNRVKIGRCFSKSDVYATY